jgi:hypothetical protein
MTHDYDYQTFCLLYLLQRQRKEFSAKRAAYIRVLQLSMERSVYDVPKRSYTVN